MLKATNLTKKYGELEALKDVDLEVKKGMIVGFLGPNGAGKTTTMRILTGYLEQDSGNVAYDGKNLLTHYQSVISNVGYLPENNPLYKNMRVDEYLLFNAQLKGITDKDALKEIAEKCGIDEMLTKEIETLSKGYKQRVGLAKALIGDPDYVILDEPTEGLDPNQKEKIHKLIKSYAKDKAVLFSSHVLSEVRDIADRIIIINEGKIVAQGKSDELIKNYFNNAQIIVKVNTSDLEKALKSITAISKVNVLSKGNQKFTEYKISCTKPEETLTDIFNTVVKNKWQIQEMYQKSQGLEDLFKELTR